MRPEPFTRRAYVAAFREPAALGGYVGDTARLRGNIESATRIVAASSPTKRAVPSKGTHL